MQEHLLTPDVLALTLSGPPRLLQGSQEILAGLLGDDEAAGVELLDDPHWEQYREIGEAWMEAGGEELSICLAVCPTRSSWAIGVAGKSKVREPAARLALAVASAAEVDAQVFGELADKWPEFLELCQLAGTVPADYEEPEEPAPTPAKRLRPAPPVQAAELVALARAWRHAAPPRLTPEGERTEVATPIEEDEEDQSANLQRITAKLAKFATASKERKESAQAPSGAAAQPLPRDRPFLIQLPEDATVPAELDGLLAEAVVVSTDGSKRKSLYSHADQAIRALLLELGVAEDALKAAVKYEDDFNWSRFPSVGEALKSVAPAEECLCVVICTQVGVWAVGVGMKGKARFAAAKAALVGGLALAAVEAGAELDFSQELPMIADYIDEVKAAKEEFFAGADEEVEDEVS